MIVALTVILTLMLALTVAATLLKAEPVPVRIRIDDVERLRRRR
ncbi:MAG: hypothetical protein WCJ55_08945 [Chloroflexales bacterium]